jgi:methanogen extracellular protein (TIGR04279 family)
LCILSLLYIGALAVTVIANAQSAPVVYDINISDYHGDNDSYIERGESAIVTFNVSSSVSLTSVSVYVNDTNIFTINSVGASFYQGNATTGALSDGNYTFKIVASNSNGNSVTTLVPYRVTRNYLGWIKVDHLWGPTQMFHTPIMTGNLSTDYYVGAVADIKGSIPDGNTITLSGGKAMQAPDIYMTVDGGMLVNRTMECLVFLGKQNGSVPLNYMFNKGSYPVYYVDSRTNNISGTLDASKDFDNMTLGVGMINMTMTPRDPVAYREYIFHDYGIIKTDANGDATLPTMEITNPDLYLVVIFDRNVSNGLGLVAVAPLYVVNYTSNVGLSFVDKNMATKHELNPGDNLMVNVTMPNATEQKYLFAAFAMPASDYKGKIDVNSTGMISDMNLTIDAFTIHFYGNYNDTIKNATTNLTWAQQLIAGWSGSNLSAAVGSNTAGKSLEMPVKIKDDAMTGQYILVTAAIHPATMKVVTLSQTTFNVVAPQPPICIPWYLILLIFLLILAAIVLYWYYQRRQ